MNASLAKYCEEKLPEKMAATVEKLMDDVISDMLRGYGDVGKALREKIALELGPSLHHLDFSQYREALLGRVYDRVQRAWDERIATGIQESMDELLKEPPKVVKMSELATTMMQEAMEYAGELPDESCTAEFNDEGKFGMLFLDPKSGNDNYSAAYRVHVCCMNDERDENGLKLWEAIAVHMPDGEEFNARSNRNKRFLGRLNGMEKLMFHLWANGTKLVVDENAVDTAYPEEECSC